MADSLRDQLIAAGYDAPKKEDKRKPRGNNNAAGKKPGRKSSANRNKALGKRPQGNSQGGNQHNNQSSRNNKSRAADQEAQAQEAIEERKKLKAKIKTLIDDTKIENWKGDVVYRYLVEKKIRELYVNEELHKQLAERTVAVTRLNGDTFLVPRETALSIKEINPQWSVFNIDADTEEEAKIKSSDAESDYADYKVPDDLKW